MAKTELDLMKDASEIIHYDTAGIPLYIRTGNLTDYPGMRALCHWHEDIEFIRIIKGSMNYRINGRKILLRENDCLMVNAKQMHYGYSRNQENCVFICVLFHPRLFTGNSVLTQKYITPVLGNQGFEYLHVNNESEDAGEAAQLLDQIMHLKAQGLAGYEIEVIGLIHILWNRILGIPQIFSTASGSCASSSCADTELAMQRNMVSYIYQNYSEKISLEDIASAGNVSRSKCCMVFKLYLQQSPIDFLNHYRLEVSCNLLKTSDLNITQIAMSCGFNHLSYYSKLFLRSYGCTPNEYRKRNRESLL